MRLILERSGNATGSLCVLGAGNCNDLDLARLVEVFSHIHLVDIDEEALSRGVNRQRVEDGGVISVSQRIDLTGALDDLQMLTGGAPRPSEINERIRRIEEATPRIDQQGFDVVVSSTTLSQVIAPAVHCLGEAHPRVAALALALRNAHLRLMVELMRPGAVGILVSDLVSSDSFPVLDDLSEAELGNSIEELVRTRNFFTGTNPFAIMNAIDADERLSAVVEDVALHPPWRWRLTESRTYLVFAISFRAADIKRPIAARL